MLSNGNTKPIYSMDGREWKYINHNDNGWQFYDGCNTMTCEDEYMNNCSQTLLYCPSRVSFRK